MEIDFPGQQDLSEDQQRLMEEFRRRLHSKLDDMALSSDEITQLMSEFRQYPELRNPMMAELRKVRERLPGPIPRTWD
jgi:hypothetical protein